MFLEISQNSLENTCARASFLIKLQARPATLLEKRLAHVFSCEFCEISKNTFFTEHRWTTASDYKYDFVDNLNENFSLIGLELVCFVRMTHKQDF